MPLRLSILVFSDGTATVNLTDRRSAEEVRDLIKDFTDDPEETACVVGHLEHSTPTAEALSGLMRIGNEHEDSFCQELEKILSDIFTHGVRYGREHPQD